MSLANKMQSVNKVESFKTPAINYWKSLEKTNWIVDKYPIKSLN